MKTLNSAPAQNGQAAPMPKKILLVDDHPLMRAGIAQLVNQQADMTICAEAGDPGGALRELARTKVDLVLSDFTMPGRSGFEFIQDLQELDSNVAILIISMHDETIYAEQALRLGARGYIMKEASGETLLSAIRLLLSGKAYVSPAISTEILDNLANGKHRNSDSPFEKLTERESAVFRLIGEGKSTREIAERFHLSAKTVDVHRGHIKKKLELKDTTALVRYAVQWVER